MPAIGIKLVGIGLRSIDPPEWVTGFDVDAHAPDSLYPTGLVDSDVDPAKAMRFDNAADALEFTMQRSTVCPFRPDGEENRPLRAFTVQIEALPEEVQ